MSKTYHGKPCVHGHGTERYRSSFGCVVCSTLKVKERWAEYRKENPKKPSTTPEQRKQQYKDYVTRNLAKVRARERLRSIRRKKAAPAWLTPEQKLEMSQKYLLARIHTMVTGFAWQVDHVIPLKGKLVSGLHVPDNLQVIPAAENRAKLNKYEVKL